MNIDTSLSAALAARRTNSKTSDLRRTVLVTGGAGFLGSQLCDRHVALGDEVICVDNLETGRLQNIAHLLDRPNFRFVRHDVVDAFDVDEPIHLIYNLACPASPEKYQIDPIRTFKTSVYGAMNLLELARQKEAQILQASTSEIYGDPLVSPQPESYWGNVNSFGPRSCYDEGKRAAETLFHDFRERHGVRTRIARIFNTYGPRMDPRDGRVVSNFVTQALRGDDITIYGDGQQTRSFCYVDDLLDGLMALMASPADIRTPVNIGNPGEFTMRELADIVLRKTRSVSRMVFKPLPKDDPRQRRPDIRLARELLDWSPKIALNDGLDPTIAYFAAELRSNGVRVAAGA
ncbi:MAG: SDR family oxidoreductase [Rhodobacterales bacterium]|nr:SDR family oxidoreductase [Rhodobacterales bacterium]NCT12183.1 SDR family oxidoreductase [Rhodobacterales bacterium]